MRVPLSWLSEFVDLPTVDTEELSHTFSMLGLTVEGVEVLEPDWTDVFVGEVVGIAAHPDADRIRVCQVDVGSGPEQIICGAWNFDVGAMVAVARPGAVLAGGFEIGQRTIRGVDSNGMICSERELGIGDDHEGILVLDGETKLGMPLVDLLELPDVVFDLDITPNRPDAMSLLGVARDLAAWYGVDYRIPKVAIEAHSGRTTLAVTIEDPVGCRRFTGREIAGLKVAPSPLKIRQRLRKMGARSISNVVDVTNYVMFELGHPLHAFDADTIVGDRLFIRRAVPGESLKTLDGVERQLSEQDLIIYDEAGPTSMSGTMGGARSEVSHITTRVLMEAASWDPPTIMHMWRRHDLRSEAATRFERGVDPNLADVANQRASAMVAALGGGVVLDGAIDEIPAPVEPELIMLTLQDVTRILGSGFDASKVTSILTRLGMIVEGTDPFDVVVPTFRPDLTRPADLIEEIARLHGFDHFEATLPRGPAGGLTAEQRRQRVLLSTLTGLGLTQAINLPFVSTESAAGFGFAETDLLTVRNPLREEEGVLRPSLLPGLLEAVRYNMSHGTDSVSLFETGRVFSPEPDTSDGRLPVQPERLGWAITGSFGTSVLGHEDAHADARLSLGVWRAITGRLRLVENSLRRSQKDGFHPGRCAEVSVAGKVVGHVGEASPLLVRDLGIQGRVAIAEIDLEPLLAPVAEPVGHSPSLFPPFDFDLSFSLGDDMPVVDLVSATTVAAAGLVESTRVFDEFFGKGARSVTINYRLRAPNRTLTAEEVAPVRVSMIEAATSLGASLRGV